MSSLPDRDRLRLARPELLREQGLIGAEWTGTAARPVVNPATGGTIARVPDFGSAETARAVDEAERAWVFWKVTTARERSDLLRRWFALILHHQEDLARIVTAEEGKPLAEARGEVAYAAAYVEWFAEEARRAYGEVTPPPSSDRRLMVFKQPVGVVAAITPWNFPAAMVTRKVAPALAAGCTVVLKPSELAPLTALALATLAEQAGMPPGVLNVVTGDPISIGEVLTGDPRIRKLSFTGSTRVGKLLAARCAATVKRVSLELGGNAPFMVFGDADLPAAVEGAVVSKFRNTGQTCVCANRFLVHADVYDDFAAALARRASQFVVGDGLACVTHQGPLIDEAARRKASAHVIDATGRGAEVMTGGAPIDGAGTYFAPTVLRDVAPDALLCREETFGPVAGLVRFTSEAEALTLANATSAGLAAYVYTSDLARTWRVSEALEYGMVGVNTGLISTEVAPFGGVKESGLGREGSRHGLDEYLDLKAVTVGLPGA